MLRIIKDRYRPVFCSDLFYLQNQKLFSEWYQLFKKLNSSQKVHAWVIALSLLRRPDDWFGGFRKNIFIKNHDSSFSHPFALADLNTPSSPIQFSKKIAELNLFQIENEVKIKALPEAALRALACFANQKYPLQIVTHVPTPKELLQIQLEGKRVISFNEDFETWPNTLYHGRDFLSFMIHDFIHADHFFVTPTHRSGQLGFYRCIQMILTDKSLQDLLGDSPFKEAFEYIISDMNSHPVHLFKTLHARLLHSIENEITAVSLWNNWTSVWSRGDLTVISALQKINTQLFSDKDALDITQWSIALGHNSRLASGLAAEV